MFYFPAGAQWPLRGLGRSGRGAIGNQGRL